MSAMLEHCQRAYELMSQDCDEYGIWEGKISDLAKLLDLSSVTGSRIFSNLKSMGSVEELRRGAGPIMGQFKLLEFPTHQHWNHVINAGNPSMVNDVTYKPKRTTNYVHMANEMSRMQNTMAIIVDKYNELEKRVQQLEKFSDLYTLGLKNNGNLGSS